MWAILGAPAVPVSVHLFARVHIATLRTMRLGEFDFRFRSVQARGPSTLQSGVLYEVGRVTGQGTPAMSGQQLDELCRGTRPWPASRALVPAGQGHRSPARGPCRPAREAKTRTGKGLSRDCWRTCVSSPKTNRQVCIYVCQGHLTQTKV